MKQKAPLLVLALAALAALAYYASRPPTDADPYETFALVMDRLSGPGQWSAQGHERSSDGLTVQGLTLKTTPEDRPDGPPLELTVDSVFIKKPVPRDRAEELLALAGWQGQPGTDLAEGIRLKGFKGLETGPERELEIKIEEMNLGGIKLAQSPPEAPAGADGFLKALRLGSLGYKNFHLAMKGPGTEASAAVESAALEGLNFSGDVPPELAGLEPDARLKPLSVSSVKSLKAEGLKLDFSGRALEAPLQGGLSLAALEGKGLQPLKAVEALKLAPLKINWTDGQGQAYAFNLAGLSLKGLDAADYLAKFLAGLAQDNPEGAEAALAGQFTLADFFVSPISLEEAALTGLDLDLAGLATVKAAEIKGTGPYRTGEIPASAKSWIKGLEINLTGDPEAWPGSPGRDIYEVSQLSGRKAFALEAESESLYEARTGRLTTRLNHLKARDLFGLSLDCTLGGLTPDRLEKFKNTPLAALYLIAALNPGDLLGDASFRALNIKYTDQGLVDLIFDLQAREAGAANGEELKQRTMAETGMMLTIMGAHYLKNTEDLSRPLLDFLKSPKSLEIDLKSAPPLTFAVVQDLNADPAAIGDALNITFSANGQAGSPLRFAASPAGGGPEVDEDDLGQD